MVLYSICVVPSTVIVFYNYYNSCRLRLKLILIVVAVLHEVQCTVTRFVVKETHRGFKFLYSSNQSFKATLKHFRFLSFAWPPSNHLSDYFTSFEIFIFQFIAKKILTIKSKANFNQSIVSAQHNKQWLRWQKEKKESTHNITDWRQPNTIRQYVLYHSTRATVLLR